MLNYVEAMLRFIYKVPRSPVDLGRRQAYGRRSGVVEARSDHRLAGVSYISQSACYRHRQHRPQLPGFRRSSSLVNQDQTCTLKEGAQDN